MQVYRGLLGLNYLVLGELVERNCTILQETFSVGDPRETLFSQHKRIFYVILYYICTISQCHCRKYPIYTYKNVQKKFFFLNIFSQKIKQTIFRDKEAKTIQTKKNITNTTYILTVIYIINKQSNIWIIVMQQGDGGVPILHHLLNW